MSDVDIIIEGASWWVNLGLLSFLCLSQRDRKWLHVSRSVWLVPSEGPWKSREPIRHTKQKSSSPLCWPQGSWVPGQSLPALSALKVAGTQPARWCWWSHHRTAHRALSVKSVTSLKWETWTRAAQWDLWPSNGQGCLRHYLLSLRTDWLTVFIWFFSLDYDCYIDIAKHILRPDLQRV